MTLTAPPMAEACTQSTRSLPDRRLLARLTASGDSMMARYSGEAAFEVLAAAILPEPGDRALKSENAVIGAPC